MFRLPWTPESSDSAALTVIANQQSEIHSAVKSIAESSARTAEDVSKLREEFHVSKERTDQRLTVLETWQTGATTWIRWLIPLLAGGGLLTGGYVASKAPAPQVIAIPSASGPISSPEQNPRINPGPSAFARGPEKEISCTSI